MSYYATIKKKSHEIIFNKKKSMNITMVFMSENNFMCVCVLVYNKSLKALIPRGQINRGITEW